MHASLDNETYVPQSPWLRMGGTYPALTQSTSAGNDSKLRRPLLPAGPFTGGGAVV